MNSSSGISECLRISRAISSTRDSVVPRAERAVRGPLNHGAIGDRIGEGHAELDQIRAAALQRRHQSDGVGRETDRPQ